MNTALFVNLSKHNIYYINGNKLSFYISLPNTNVSSTNITIELNPDYEKIDPNKNDGVWIKDEITRIYKEVDNSNISLVIPIFYDNNIKQTDTAMDQNIYLEIDSNLSSVINSSYQILTKSNINVDKKIYLINNGNFNNFSMWFLQRYGARIESKTYSDILGNQNPNTVPYSNPVNNNNINVQSQSTVPASTQAYVQQPIEQPQNAPINPNQNMEFVTGSNNETPVVEPPTTGFMNNTPANENVEVPQAGSAGFVSYLLLGIITVIICLGILYIML